MVHVRLANGHPIRVDDFRPTVSRAGSQAAVHHCRNLHVQCSEPTTPALRHLAPGRYLSESISWNHWSGRRGSNPRPSPWQETLSYATSKTVL